MPSILEQQQTALKTIGMELTDKSSIHFSALLHSKTSSDKLIKNEQEFYNVSHLPLVVGWVGLRLFTTQHRALG